MKIAMPKASKWVSLILILIMFGISAFGCFRIDTETTDEVIAQDEPWFTSRKIEIDCNLLGNVDATLPIFSDSDYILYNRIYDEDLNPVNSLICISLDTSDAYFIDYRKNFEGSESVSLEACFRAEEGYCLILAVTTRGAVDHYIGKIDIQAQSINDIETISFENVQSNTIRINKVISRNDNYYLGFEYADGNKFKYGFKCINPSQETNEEMTVDDLILLWTVNPDGEILYFAYEGDNAAGVKNHIYKIDFDGERREIAVDQELAERYSFGILSEEGNVCMTNPDLTITSVDLSSFEETTLFNYNDCDVNIADLYSGSPSYIDNETIVFINEVEQADGSSSFCSVTKLQRADQNPNIGKKIIYAAPFNFLDIGEAEAVRYYNRISEDCYCYVTMDYSLANFESICSSHAVLPMEKYQERELLIVDVLEQDILAGIGPDILFGFGQFASLDNSNYLMDLNSFIDEENGINRDDYYDNILRAFEHNGKLYQLPISISLLGIYTEGGKVGSNTKGFTYDTYSSFVQDKCNGFDPIELVLGQTGAFKLMLMNNYDHLYSDPYTLSINNEHFELLSEYTRGLSDDHGYFTELSGTWLVSFSDFYSLASNMFLVDSSYRLLGLPSIEETGPMAEAVSSAGITSCSHLSDDAWECLLLCLGMDIQGMCTGNPVNRAASINRMQTELSAANEHIEKKYGISGYYDESIIDCYDSYLSSAEVSAEIDSVTFVIMSEEMPAFFEGVKSLGDTVTVIDNRVNNMLAERKP